LPQESDTIVGDLELAGKFASFRTAPDISIGGCQSASPCALPGAAVDNDKTQKRRVRSSEVVRAFLTLIGVVFPLPRDNWTFFFK
jgi:hypothetical protein